MPLAVQAHHQAGHAVAQQVLDLPVVPVTVSSCAGVPSPDWADPTRYCDDEQRLLAERHITSLFAGSEAERRYRFGAGRRDDRAVERAARADLDSAIHLAVFVATHPNADSNPAWRETDLRRLLGLPDPKPFPAVDLSVVTELLDRGRLSATRLVRENWPLVEDLAEQLLASDGAMGADQISRILSAPHP